MRRNVRSRDLVTNHYYLEYNNIYNKKGAHRAAPDIVSASYYECIIFSQMNYN